MRPLRNQLMGNPLSFASWGGGVLPAMLKMLVTSIAALPPDLSVLTAARRVTTELEQEKA